MRNKSAIFYWIAASVLLVPRIYASAAVRGGKVDPDFTTAVEQASVPGTQMHFPVAKLHVGTWCMGYFYVIEEGIR